ncbi:Sister chromatid cohesion protein [Entamoeba marina]
MSISFFDHLTIYLSKNDFSQIFYLIKTNQSYISKLSTQEKDQILNQVSLTQKNQINGLYAASIHILLSLTPDFKTITELLHAATSNELHTKSTLHSTFSVILHGLASAIKTRSLTESALLVTLTPALLILNSMAETLHGSASSIVTLAWRYYNSLIPQLLQDIVLSFISATLFRATSVISTVSVMPLSATTVIALQIGGDYNVSMNNSQQFVNTLLHGLQNQSSSHNFLSFFGNDLLLLATDPHFPSAAIILQCLIHAILPPLIHNSLTPQLRHSALDLIAQTVSLFNTENQLLKSQNENLSSSAQEICGICGNTFSHTEALHWTNVPSGICGVCYSKELINDFWKKLTGREADNTVFIQQSILCIATTSLVNDTLNTMNSQENKDIVSFIDSYRLLCSCFSNKNEINKRYLEEQMGWNPQQHFISNGVNLIEIIGRFAPINHEQYLQTIINTCLNCIIRLTGDSQAMMRARSLKGLASVVKSNGELLNFPVIQSVIVNRLRDKSAAVREGALELISQRINTNEVNAVVERLFDVSISVRKKAVKIVLNHLKSLIPLPGSAAEPLLKHEAKKILKEVFIPVTHEKIKLLVKVVDHECIEAVDGLVQNFNATQYNMLLDYLINNLTSDDFSRIVMLLKTTAHDTVSKLRIAEKLSVLIAYIGDANEEDIQINNKISVIDLIIKIVPSLQMGKAEELLIKKLVRQLLQFILSTSNSLLLTVSVQCFVQCQLKLNAIEQLGDFCVQWLKLSSTLSVRHRALNILSAFFKCVDVSKTQSLKNYFPQQDKPITVELFNLFIAPKNSTKQDLILTLTSVFSLLHQYPGLYLHFQTIRNYVTVYISKTLTVVYDELTTSTLSLLHSLLTTSTTDDLSALQTTLAQNHLEQLQALLLHQNLQVRHKTLLVIQAIISSGLVNPITLIPYIIALLTDTSSVNAAGALSTLRLLAERHTSLIAARFLDGVDCSVQLKNVYVMTTLPHPFTTVFTFFNTQQRKQVINSLVSKITTLLGNKLSGKDMVKTIFLIETVTLLQYNKTSEVQNIVQPLLRIISVELPEIRHSIKKNIQLNKKKKKGDVVKLVVGVFAASAAKFLMNFYNLSNDNQNDISTSIADLPIENHPFAFTSSFQVEDVFEDQKVFNSFWVFSKRIVKGDYIDYHHQDK